MMRRLLVVVVLAAIGALTYAAIRAHRDLTDFEVYRTAATRAASAEPLYRPDDGHYQFKYLPAFAVAARPLALMSDETAKRVWFGISFALSVVFVWTLVRTLPDRRLPCLALAAWTTLVVGKFFVRELALGQTNALLAVLLLPAIVRPDRHPRLAGVAAGAAVFVKPYALLMLPWLAVRQPRAATLSAALAIAVGLLVPVATYGWAGNLSLLGEWWRTVTDTTAPNLFHPDNVSVVSMWAKWLGPLPGATVLGVATAIALLGEAGWTCWAGRGGRGPVSPSYLEAGLLMLLMPLLSPQGWDYVLLLGTPVVIALIDRWPDLPSGARQLVIGVAIVLATPIRLFMPVVAYNAVMDTAIVSVAAIVLVGLGTSLRAKALL